MRLVPDISRRSRLFGQRSAVTAMLFVFAVVVVLVTVFILSALEHLVDHVNRLDDGRSWETTTGAMDAFQQRLLTALGGQVFLVEAAQADTRRKSDWIDRHYRAVTMDGIPFDVAIVADAGIDAVMAWRKGASLDVVPRDYIDSSLQVLLDRAVSTRADGARGAVGFARTKDGIAAIGIAPIPDAKGKAASPPRFLILARLLDRERLLKLAKTFGVDGLRFARPGERAPSMVEIRNAAGEVLENLVWQSQLPGNLAYGEVRPRVYSALAMVGLFFLLLFVSGSKTLNRLTSDEAAARRLALTDRLSGLLNRSGFFAALDELVASSRSDGSDVVLLYLDLDGFKEVNDAYGHATGDRLIRGVSAGLQALVPKGAILGRVGGDEFAIAVTTRERARLVETTSDRVLGFFDEPFILGERVATVGTSIGVAVSVRGKVSGEELVRRADMAMYRVKETGRGRSEFYRPEMDAEREERNRLEIDLRIAIERRELNVVYQPVVDARSWRLVGVEALARWNRKGHGPVLPDVFIPIAESTGLIDQLGLFVLHRSCETLASWPELTLSVNVSPGQFRDPAFVEHVRSVFRKTATDPDRITLEMTEGYFIQNPERARAALAKLRRLGLRIALDDFGSGFSSVGYLRQFGFDRMKIDRSLVQALDEGGSAVEMLQATVSLARSLDIPVTAEGVESETQAIQLHLSGCDALQGYLFGKPMAAEEIDALYRGNRLPAGARIAA